MLVDRIMHNITSSRISPPDLGHSLTAETITLGEEQPGSLTEPKRAYSAYRPGSSAKDEEQCPQQMSDVEENIECLSQCTASTSVSGSFAAFSREKDLERPVEFVIG